MDDDIRVTDETPSRSKRADEENPVSIGSWSEDETDGARETVNRSRKNFER
ncbi:hypothetical protein [Halorussus amylolyticus]|uniref:hypothetical protein n=1 Tax=Halorussus amylolyticus TaxID=1126242 RepID=UPI00192F154C|nr:hypothetical protein [Halorussus amylolyticus]